MRWFAFVSALFAMLSGCRYGYDPLAYLGNGAAGDAGSAGAGINGGTGGGAGAGAGVSSGGVATGGTSGQAGAAGATQVSATCRTGAYEGHDYAFCDGELERDRATADCELKDMSLVRIDDAAENLWVHGEAFALTPAGDDAEADWRWLGAEDRAVEGTWRWPDGEEFWQGDQSGSVVNGLYNNWLTTAPGEPAANLTGYDCAIMRHETNADGGVWQAQLCRIMIDLHPYVCEAY